MADYLVTITPKQTFILLNALAKYNTDNQNVEGFTPLNALQFVNKIVELELENKEKDVLQQYRQIIDVLGIVPSETRTSILDALPQRIKNYLQTL